MTMDWLYFILLFLIFRLCLLVEGQNCFGGIESYEKSTNLAFASHVRSNTILERQGQSLTRDCINLCKQEAQCYSFALDYPEFRCFSYSVNSIGRRDLLVDQPRTNFFEKICIRGVDRSTYDSLCGDQLWTFERVKEAFLDGYVDREVRNVQNKEECEKLCLMEMSFTCRSADYDEIQRLCRMSREDRRSQPQAFRQVPGSSRDYIENLCISSTPTTCKYQQRPDRSVISTDFLN
ncbi:protein let-653-like [Limulus polyphemus]|uniref:Protein let-653-like n=1 Tax=Limulus polyphemus TaxID=6850 RepID=A0ABM1SI87_LIMPO|nr:protein let-653-like [Limulus polyphemus]